MDIPRPRRLGSVRLAELESEVLQRVMQRGESETRLRKQGKFPEWRRYCRHSVILSQCFGDLLVQIAREIFQPFQLFQRRAHFLLTFAS